MVRFYEVGGCVRDELLGRSSKDVDYTVTGYDSFQAMVNGLVARGYELFKVSPDTFTARGRLAGSRDTYDFVFARKEGPYSDGRHPDYVEAGTLEDDLARRDFTMNAIAKDTEGNLIDPFGGVRDIRHGVIRTVGKPEDRFREDALRILRAVRFSVTLGFRIHRDTALAITRLGHTLSVLPVERIREELERAFAHDTLATLAALRALGLERHVFDRGLRLTATTKA